LRFADHRGQNSVFSDVGDQPIDHVAPDGICDRIQILQAAEFLVHGHDLVCPQLFASARWLARTPAIT
jgi:hypothetical protein